MKLLTLIFTAFFATCCAALGCKQHAHPPDTHADAPAQVDAAGPAADGHSHAADTAPGAERDHEPEDAHEHEHGAEAEHDPDHSADPRSIAVPEAVRTNLGITFVRVEQRPVASTIRVPGRFELLPNARRDYHTMLAGRVEILVNQFDRVETGTPLYRLDSPPWRELQEKLNAADAAIRQAQVRAQALGPLRAAHREHAASLQENVTLWTQRVAQLDQSRTSGVVTADEYTTAQTALATNRAQLAEVREKEAELAAQQEELQFELDAAQARMKLLIETASTLLGVSEAELSAACTPESHANAGVAHHTANGPSPLWREIDRITVRANAAGVVEQLAVASGAWASEASLVLTTIQPERMRFRARGMQSDLGRLADGLPARIVPPAGGSLVLHDQMEGKLIMGLAADPEERTVEVFLVPQHLAAWARPGVAAYLEIFAAGGAPAFAVPTSAIVQDGLEKILFRRDPANPDVVWRVPAALGVSDGRWTAVTHGVRPGDEVVLDGVYQLMLATTGTAQPGGHFDPDGTFHTGKH